MTDPLPGQPIQIQLPPVLQEIMQQYPLLLSRLTALEAKPQIPAGLPAWLVAAAAFAYGLLALLVGQWVWTLPWLSL